MSEHPRRVTPPNLAAGAPGRTGPLVAAGAVLGFGMGGFVDGIVLHQLLQWHHMISARVPADSLTNVQINMFWDGVFHALTWMATAAGIWLLWRAARQPDVARSTPVLLGSLLLGWGLFNLADSVLNHYLFNFHNVRENVPNVAVYNAAFLGLSVVQIGAGWWVISGARLSFRTATRP